MPTSYIPQTWADDWRPTPASGRRMSVIEQGIQDVHYSPACRAYLTLNMTIQGAGTLNQSLGQPWVNITLPGTSYDSDRMRDPAYPGRIGIRTPGIYWFTAEAMFQTPTNACVRAIRLLQNGSTVLAQQLVPSTNTGGVAMFARVGVTGRFAVGDYVEMGIIHDDATHTYVVGSPPWQFATAMAAQLLVYT